MNVSKGKSNALIEWIPIDYQTKIIKNYKPSGKQDAGQPSKR